MTDTKLITAVLESCGWTPSRIGDPWTAKDPQGEVHFCPALLTSLDACHEVLPMLDEDFREQVWFKVAHMDYNKLLDMTARDWCEAWLRYKGITI